MRKNLFKVFLWAGIALAIWPISVISAKETGNEPKLNYRQVEVRTTTVEEGKTGKAAALKALPSKYVPANLLDSTKYPAVRNQNPYGTCWAETTIGLAELSILYQENKLMDLSELHTAYFMYNSVVDPLGGTEGDKNEAGWNRPLLELGGNLFFSRILLSNWCGAADELLLPYSTANNNMQINTAYAYKDKVHLRNCYSIDMENNSNLVKEAISKYGGVGIAYNHDSSKYNRTYNSYYTGGSDSVNHAVIVVGWDDGFSKNNFTIKPPTDGAWLIRNSWGEQGYSEYGYFWMSYCESFPENVAYAFDCVSEDSSEYYDNNYQYDGSADSSYLFIGEGVKCANVFTAQKDSEQLKAVSLALGGNSTYTIKVYTNVTGNPESGTLVATENLSSSFNGIYTVKLRNPVNIYKNNKFSVVVTLNSTENAYPYIECENEINDFIKCTYAISQGQSFIYNGSWNDFTGINYSIGNLRIKALTDTVSNSLPPVTGIKIVAAESSLEVGSEAILLTEITPASAASNTISWSSSNNNVASVDQDGKVTVKGNGKATITARAANGNKSASIVIEGYTKIKSLDIETSYLELYAGQSYKVKYSIIPSNATEKPVWRSWDDSIVQVDQNGNVTALREGFTAIDVSNAGGDILDIFQVYVKKDPGHSPINYKLKSASFSADGSKSYYYCSHCNSYYSDKACSKKISDIQTWKVIPKIGKVSLKSAALVYSGKNLKPSVKVLDKNGKAIDSKYYSVTFPTAKNVGSYQCQIKFKDYYSGSKKLSFKINPKGTSISKVAAGSGRLTINWKKQATQADGYELYLATDKSFKKNLVKVTVSKNSTVKKTVSKLKKKTGYYIRIRTFKKVKDKTYYSAWSQFNKVVKTK